MKNEKKKALYGELSPYDYKLLEMQLKRRNLDKTNYIRYLIRKDQDDIYSPKAAEALNGVSSSTVTIMNMVSEDSDIYSESDIFTFGAFCYHERNGRFRTGWN